MEERNFGNQGMSRGRGNNRQFGDNERNVTMGSRNNFEDQYQQREDKYFHENTDRIGMNIEMDEYDNKSMIGREFSDKRTNFESRTKEGYGGQEKNYHTDTSNFQTSQQTLRGQLRSNTNDRTGPSNQSYGGGQDSRNQQRSKDTAGSYGEEGVYGNQGNLKNNMRSNRDDFNSSGMMEKRKSIGDKRMERDFGSGLVKNPFDPSNRAENKQRGPSRLNEDEFDLPCMNPPAPEPTAGPRASGPPPTRPTGPGTEPGGPDYASLLQYLQFYQKQMGPEERQ